MPSTVDQQPTTSDTVRDLTVDDLMSTSVAVVHARDDLWSVLQRFHLGGLRHLVVLGEDDRFVCVLSDRLVVDHVEYDRRELETVRLDHVVLDRGTCIPTGSGVVAAATHVLQHASGALAVVDGDRRVLGIVTGADLLRALVA